MSQIEFPSVAVIRSDHIGDLVLTTPLFRALAEGGWKVDVVAPPHGILLQGNPSVRDVFSLETICPNWPSDWKNLGRWLRSRRYRAVIVPFAHPRQLLLASLFSGAKIRVAMWGGWPARLTGHRTPRSNYFDRPRPLAQTTLRCLDPLGVPAGGIEPELYLSEAERAQGESLLAANLRPETRVGIHPFSMGNACNLPLAIYRALSDRILRETDFGVVVTGSKADRDRLEDWKELAAAHPGRLWLSAGELPLRPLAAVIAGLNLYVVPSTGPLHIAAALRTETLSPFCPQVPVCATIWGHPPYEKNCITPQHPACNPHAIHVGACDFAGRITADDLFRRLTARLSSPRPGAAS